MLQLLLALLVVQAGAQNVAPSKTPPMPSAETIVSASDHGDDPGLTAVTGILVGQVTLEQRPTGCTVILAPEGTIASGEVRGGAPASRETDLLRPENLIQNVHAVVLSGGSAFGLDAASGVMRFLEERGVGFPIAPVPVPIVVGASLFDLPIGADPKIRPDAACGYAAAQRANADPVAEGNVGAGAGATVGKMLGLARAMKGGLGSASIRFEDGLVVAALVAVNAVGDVVDPATGAVIAGVRDDRGALADVRKLLRSGRLSPPTAPGALRENALREDARENVRREDARENTSIGVVATNARLTKAQAFKVAQMAHDGMARAVVPSHTLGDGDTLVVLATGESDHPVNTTEIGALAAEVVATAIVRAIRAAEGLPGLPAARDLVVTPSSPDD